MEESQYPLVIGNWLETGLGGVINLIERYLQAGLPLTKSQIANLTAQHRRLGELLAGEGVLEE